MAFSQSMHLGNSTFMNLELEVKRAIENKNDLSASTLIVEQSQKRINKSCFKPYTFRRNKSDDALFTKSKCFSNKTTTSRNYSKYLCSDFQLSFEELNDQSGSEVMRAFEHENTLIKCYEIRDLEKSKCIYDPKKELSRNFQRISLSNVITQESIQKCMINRTNFAVMCQHQTKLTNDLDEAKMLDALRNKGSEEYPLFDELLSNQRHLLQSINSALLPSEINRIRCKSVCSSNAINISNLSKRQAPHQSKSDFESLKNISTWDLPATVLREYEKKGVIKMFDWQVECLSNPKVLHEHCNLIYSAPTSAGKTLVSEILLLKTVLERLKKVLLILPFISVVREKMLYLQDLLTPAGYRVEGFFGGYTPPGGFECVHVAICTIEKANSIVNKLLEQDKLDVLGMIVVDEVHLISDPGRGYILELLLAKILYMSRKYVLQIQIIAMSATLANVELLKCWLNAELYITDFRPVTLHEMIKVGSNIYDSSMQLLCDISKAKNGIEYKSLLKNDTDHVAQLCIETLLEGCSVLVFCASKDWCENLALQLASAIHAVGKNGGELGLRLRTHIKRAAIDDVKRQLRSIPTGLEATLEKTVTFGCAFHHAGLTTEERDIIEASFKSGALKIIVATSTLSSGVNLPARRVIIRSPLFGNKQMSPLTYRQMIGRAGRTGKDTVGESILICTDSNARIGQELMNVDLEPISSCLHMDDSTHLKRALLEVIAAGVTVTRGDIESFVRCTLLGTQKQLYMVEKDKSMNGDNLFINDSLDFLINFEFIRFQFNEDTKEENYFATRLGMACLASSIPPSDGLILFLELQKSRRCFVLESELHAVYLVTPYSVCHQLQDLDWLLYLDLWEKLTPIMKRVGEMVGIKESFLVRAMRGQSKLDYNLIQVHKRFYIALALQELVNEVPINEVANKYKCARGILQGLQQTASTFAGIVTSFCNSLQWSTLSLIVAQFKDRLFFGIHHDLIDLMRLPDMNSKRARALFDSGITTLFELANANVNTIEKVLYNAFSFDSAKQYENENAAETVRRNLDRNIFITGKKGSTVAEAAKQLIDCARRFVQFEIGVENIDWSKSSGMHMTYVEQNHIDRKHNKSLIREHNVKKELLRRKNKEYMAMSQMFYKDNEIKQGVNTMTDRLPLKRNKHVEVSFSRSVNENSLKSVISATSPARNISLEIVTEDRKKKLSGEDKVGAKRRSKLLTYLQSDNGHQEELKIDQIEKENTFVVIDDIKPLKSSTSEELEISLKNFHKTGNYSQQKIQRQTYNSKNTLSSSKINIFKIPLKRMGASATLNNMKTQDKAIAPCRSPCSNINKSIETLDRVNNEDIVNLMMYQNDSSNTKLHGDLFMEDESFEINSALESDLGKVTGPNISKTIIGSKQIKKISLNKNDHKETSSKDLHQIGYPARLLVSSKTYKESLFSEKNAQQEKLSQFPSNIAEFLDLSDDYSLVQHPNNLNASHILSCSELNTNSSRLDCVQIVNICGDRKLFEKAFKELMSLKRFGISLGLQKHNGKRKPIIGAKLLINQKAANEKNALDIIKIVDFQIDDSTYLAGIAFAVTDNIIFYLNMQQEGNANEATSSDKCLYLRKLLASKDITLMSFDARDQLKILLKIIPELEDINVELEDPKIANWLLQPDKILTLQQMVQQYAPECSAIVSLCGNNRGYNSYGLNAESSIPSKIRCSVEACVIGYVLNGQIENLEGIGTGQLHKFFKELEMPLQYSLCRMELFGFPADEKTLKKIFQQMVETMKKLEMKIYQLHGTRFNLSSSTAVAKVLGLHHRPNGRTCTSKQILEKINSPMSQLIISYRKLNVCLYKNVQPLLKTIRNNRIHGQSNTLTLTGRISMLEPNLQNVAKDFNIDLHSDNQKIRISCRSAFFAENPDRFLISSDFCQLEMRILAHLSRDDSLMKIMHTDNDVFIAMAALWNKIPEETVSEQLRNATKQICYGIVYGMSIQSLADALKCTEQEAKLISNQFYATFPGIMIYSDKVVKFARNNGYIETITGRRRYLDHINSCEAHLKNQAERQALNSAVQGSAADITKSAILRMERNILKNLEKLSINADSVRLVLHLHDELIFEVPEEKARKVAKILKMTMENCVKLKVPLKVKLKKGRSWSELEEISV